MNCEIEARDEKTVTVESSGFTLIEMLVVLVIIMVLAGIIVGAAKYARTKAARSRAQAEIAAIETALESYKSDYGAYPILRTERLITLHSSCGRWRTAQISTRRLG